MVTLHVVGSTLERAGFDVRTSSDLDALATAFGGWKPDLILTDVNMPGLSGVELCRKLKSSYETAHVPVVLYSSLDDDALAKLARECEADGFLSKSKGLDVLPKELAFLIESTVF
jgi:CheY-like chemotaxis protein